MPIHDWTRIDAGIFHDFHHAWISEIKRTLNGGVLPSDYYALVGQFAGGLGPDLLTLQGSAGDGNGDDEHGPASSASPGGGAAVIAAAPAPALVPTDETDLAFYRRKQNAIVVRHVTGDRVVAMAEVVSSGNKAACHAIRSFLEKAAELLDRRIHLLILDLFPPGPRDPDGIHAAIWEEIAGHPPAPAAAGKPLTLAGYEAALQIRAYARGVAVGDALPDMPLFLEPGRSVQVPLEASYREAFSAVPRRWRAVLEPRA